MDAELARAVSQSAFLSLLPVEDLRRLLSYSAARQFDAGAVLYRAGEPADRFYLVMTGNIGLCGADSPGQGGLVDVLAPGDLAGEEAVFDRGLHATTAQALLPSRALAVAADPFFAHLDDRFEVVLALLAGSSARLRGMIHEITELKLRSTTRRLANFLVGIAGARREGAVRIVLPCEKHQLADRLGMKPESLSRAFAKLRPHGVATGRGDDVLIDDIGLLRRYCRSGDFNFDA